MNIMKQGKTILIFRGRCGCDRIWYSQTCLMWPSKGTVK